MGMERQADMTKLIVAFRNFANAPKITQLMQAFFFFDNYIRTQTILKQSVSTTVRQRNVPRQTQLCIIITRQAQLYINVIRQAQFTPT